MAQFGAINGPATNVILTLTAAQVAVARTFEVGITSSFSGASPTISANGGA